MNLITSSIRHFIVIVLKLIFALGISDTIHAATKYVNTNAVCASADGTLNKLFCTIQEAVDVTSLTVTPSILTPGGTIKIQATGLAQ